MQAEQKESIGFTINLNQDFETALAKTISALKEQGFGVLTEIDVKDTIKKKLDKDVPPYKILGACNPPLAYRALSNVPEVGLLLPCNVIVRQVEDGSSQVGIIDPLSMLGFFSQPELQAVAQEARTRLEKVAQVLSE